MTNLFEERERAFEAKWAHDEEMQFRVLMRRNELLGRWVAQELGLSGAEREHYVAALVALGLKNKDPAMLFEKLRADLGVSHSSAALLRQIDEFLRTASLDVGLERRRPLGGEKPSDQTGEREGRVDFDRILEHGESGAEREDETHFRMLRKIRTRSG